MIKKQYSFRLKNSDEDLGRFIKKFSSNFKSESEAIRQMLLYAHRHMLAERKQNEQINQIQHDLKLLIDQQDKYTSDILKSIENANITDIGTKEEENEEAHKIAQDTAKALLGGFGLDFDQ